MEEPSSPRNFRFDWTLNIGHLLTILAIVGGGSAAWSSMQGTIAVLTTRIDQIDTRTRDFPDIQARVAEHKVRLDAMDDMQKSVTEALRRINDRINVISSDTSAIRGRLEATTPERDR